MWADTDCVMSTQETVANDTEADDTEENEDYQADDYQADDIMVRRKNKTSWLALTCLCDVVVSRPT
jgi:hypothetical protein